jgi:2-polyprenyl-3-methyl-5-hydroxy-6-metoxy-1,4-benzoquinol methylase
MQSTPYHSSINQELLDLIPGGLSKLVDVGCMGGLLAQAYRARNPQAHYIGIEANAEYARAAQAHCSEVLVADIEALDAGTLSHLGSADAWIFGDVLEHLRDPWFLLENIRLHSPRPPVVLVCLPNMQHWSVIARLLRGEIFYEDAGLLDRTHLRWFTRLTATRMLESAGYRVEQVVAKVHPVPCPDVLRQGLEAAGLAAGAADLNADASVYQWVFRASARLPVPDPTGHVII